MLYWLWTVHAVSETTQIAFSLYTRNTLSISLSLYHSLRSAWWCAIEFFVGIFRFGRVVDKFQSRQVNGSRSICSNVSWQIPKREETQREWESESEIVGRHRPFIIILSRENTKKMRKSYNYYKFRMSLFVRKDLSYQTNATLQNSMGRIGVCIRRKSKIVPNHRGWTALT